MFTMYLRRIYIYTTVSMHNYTRHPDTTLQNAVSVFARGATLLLLLSPLLWFSQPLLLKAAAPTPVLNRKGEIVDTVASHQPCPPSLCRPFVAFLRHRLPPTPLLLP
jgi:hypothetical protein